MRAIEWVDDHLVLVDQTELPRRSMSLHVRTVGELVEAIVRLAVRGAPALGVAGALGVVVAIDEAERAGYGPAELQASIDRLRNCRPTAVNLAWGVDAVRPLIDGGRAQVLAAALRIMAEDERANRELSRLGADWLLTAAGETRRPLRILTHCNTGALATSAWGTALGIVRELHARGHLHLVYADETRPLLQGSRLTAWELADEGIRHRVQVDSAAAGTILRGLVDAAVIGADRIAANGDTANKIGSVGVALACADAGIPFVVAAPWSTVDLATPDGAAIEIEHRDPAEVLEFAGVRTAPATSEGFNPAFDVTPARLITSIVTERGVIEPSRGDRPDTAGTG